MRSRPSLARSPASAPPTSISISGVTSEIATLSGEISGLGPADLDLDFSSDGKWDTDLVINLAMGVTLIDIDTGGNDLTLTNENLLFNGPSGAFAIVRVPDDANFVVNGSNIIIGDGGIELNNVLFTSFKDDNNQHFNFNDTILNGVAFWDLSDEGQVSLNNAQGCTQLVGAKVNLNDVRLNSCASLIPEPATGSLLALGLAGLAASGTSRRRRLRS
ncbi:MAG: PEP-CTERM sorting domain-containing protein [Deltaproteobacteria bacterium]|nr:PEP-CTERM sorting domain-containing protein [Deltaproteobacteria bacterium]